MIIDIAWGRGAISDVVCMGSPVIIFIYKKVNKQVATQKIANYSRDHSTSIKSIETN